MKQTEIRFTLESDTNEPNGDIRNEAQPQSTKRPRTELEDTDHLTIPLSSPTGSATSIGSTESRETIINNNINDDRPREFQRKSPAEEDAERVHIVRLERLRDKSDRYSSHIGFLKDCIEAKIIPKGLRIDLEPSIGNQDEAFCAAWFAKLEEFSFSLMDDVIKYCETIETETEDKIRLNKEALETMMDPDDHKELSDTMDNLAVQRRKRLSQTKKKKFYYLRYNRPERRSAEESRRDQDRQTNRSERRGTGVSLRDTDRDQRNRPERQEQHQRNRPERLDEYNERRNDDHRTSRDDHPSRQQQQYHQRNTDRYGADRNNNYQERYAKERHRHERQEPQYSGGSTRDGERHETTRKTSYRDILMNSRNGSRTTMKANNVSRHASRDNIPRRTDSRTSTMERHTERQTNGPREVSSEKDREIKALQERIRSLEAGRTTSKNEGRPPSNEPPNPPKKAPNQKDILELITTTMATLEHYKRALTN